LIIERFKTSFARNIFRQKYAQGPEDSWDALADRLVEDVCGTRWGTQPTLMSPGDRKELAEHIKAMRFLPGGRYLYYAGRPLKAYNNCYLLRAEEDTREEWAAIFHRASSCLLTGGGIGVDYSASYERKESLFENWRHCFRSYPGLCLRLTKSDETSCKEVQRRSAIYASLNWQHEDIPDFLTAKNWSQQLKDLKAQDFNFPAPLDMTNISVNYDDAALYSREFIDPWGNPDRDYVLHKNPVFLENCKQAMMTGEPGFSFNFGDKQNETLRNACTEVTSEDDS
jgi:ribonucleoside-diphosphate reductase alpha chain